jgi:hypothetical protein
VSQSLEQEVEALERRVHANGAPVDDAPFAVDQGTEPPPPLVQFLDHDDLFAPEPKTKAVVADLGMTPGPPIGFFGESFTGKTIVAKSGGMSVALGRDLWGLYPVRQGLWVHMDYEQGRRRTKTIVQRLAAGFGVSKDELRGKMRVAIYPALNLTTAGAADHFARAFDGAAIATLDPLKGLTPGVDENSSQMRDYMGALSLASEKTGAAVVLIHNAGKPDEARARKHAGRGSSAIFDVCAAVFVMTARKGEPIYVTHEKDRELGLQVADFGLRIEDVTTDDGNPKGGLRVVHLDREQLKPPTAGGKPASEFESLKDAILEVVRQHQDLKSGNAIEARVKGSRTKVLQAVRELLAEGRLAQPGGEGSPFRVVR